MRKKVIYLPFFIGIIILVFILEVWQVALSKKNNADIFTSSTLVEAIDIAELSATEFRYNGIAEAYKDNKKKKVECYIRYNATVKAGIDMNLVEFEIDNIHKIVKAVLPKVDILSNDIDEKSLSFVPSDIDMDLKDVLIVCQNDALLESRESSELLKSAETNLKLIIEALLYPIIKPQGYEIIWEETEEEIYETED